MKKVLLIIAVFVASVNLKSQCSDLIISKYCSMGSNNKAIEIYNPTSAPIDMKAGGYFLARYKTPTASGNTSGPIPSYPNFSDTLHLRGTIPAYGTWVVANPETTPNTSNSGAICNPILQAKANQLGNIYGTYGVTVGDPTYFKGSDVISIEKTGGTTPVDFLGRFGDYMASSTGKPSAWSTLSPYTGGTGMGWWLTKGYMLVRKSSVTTGVTVNPTFFITLNEYDTIAVPKTYQDTINTWNLLGSHTSVCFTGINEINKSVVTTAYPNPVTDGNITFKSSEVINAYSVYSFSGELMMEKTLSSKENTLTVKIDNLSKGIYMVRFRHTGGQYSATRFIKD